MLYIKQEYNTKIIKLFIYNLAGVQASIFNYREVELIINALFLLVITKDILIISCMKCQLCSKIELNT